MGKLIQATVTTAFVAIAPLSWGQATPDLYDSAGKAVGQYKGDSVVISYNNQPVRIYTDAHWDYTQGKPVTSGLTWKFVAVYYATADCTGTAYLGTSPTAPTTQGTPAPTTGPSYSSPAYGSQYLIAPTKQGEVWTANVSAQNPTYSQVAITSERQYDGTCAAKTYATLWVTPVAQAVPLNTYGVPPFYVR